MAATKILDAALKAIVIAVIAGFVGFLLIGGAKSAYAVPVLLSAVALCFILWPVFFLIDRRATQGTPLDETPMAGDTNAWLSGRTQADDAGNGDD